MLGDEEYTLQQEVERRSEEAGVGDVLNTQVLYFDTTFGNNDIRLLELTPELYKTFKTEKEFILRGDAEDDTVLCTADKSYSVKQCTTSNSLLLIPDLATGSGSATTDLATGSGSATSDLPVRNVHSVNFQYYELKLCRAKLDKMKQILSRAAYRGVEEEEGLAEYRVSFPDLLAVVQGSEEEIKLGLDEMGAIELNGYWRIIEHDYKTSAMSRILTLLEEKEWSWEKVPVIESCHTLAELQPRFVTELCLRLYGNQVEESESEVYIKLEEVKISRFYGEYILSSTAGKFNLSEFQAVWEDSVPDGMKTELAHLRGLAVISRETRPQTISYLPLSGLPVDPTQRFATLFMRRERWNHDDIIPYLEDLIGPGQTVNSLLLKHCRSSTNHITKTKVYNSKIRT